MPELSEAVWPCTTAGCRAGLSMNMNLGGGNPTMAGKLTVAGSHHRSQASLGCQDNRKTTLLMVRFPGSREGKLPCRDNRRGGSLEYCHHSSHGEQWLDSAQVTS